MSNRQLHLLDLCVKLCAPWLVHGNDPGQQGIDAVQLTGPDGRRVLPGTLVAGRLRDAWKDLAAMPGAPDGAEWFGAPPANYDEPHASREPRRGRIFVDDLVEAASASDGSFLPGTRLRMDESSGTGEEGMLLFIEQREAPGAEITFNGVWRAWLDEAESQALPMWIVKGLRWQTQLGALRNIGFGVVAEASVRAAPATSETLPSAEAVRQFAASPLQRQRGLILRFDQPIAVSNRLINGNLFSSGDVIPGAAIKGALATMLRAEGVGIPSWFDGLRISHALPSASGRRPSPLPLSLVADRHSNVWEWVSDGAAVLGGEALAFQPDWKKGARDAARSRQGWGRTRTHLRVRTAIEDGHAAAGKLFAYACRLADANPGSKPDADTETCWAATLDHPGASPAEWQAIGELLGRGTIGPIGKTDAFSSVALAPDPVAVWAPSLDLAPGAEVRLLLMTDALLFPATWAEGNTSTNQVDLTSVYQKAFAAMARATPDGDDKALTLQHFFASQRLVGGDYLRLRRRPRAAQAYRPYVLTEPGSVFVFQVDDTESAAALLNHWQRYGLPLGDEVMQQHGQDWRTNPYVPQNGYGEVCVNPQHGFAPLAADDLPRS